METDMITFHKIGLSGQDQESSLNNSMMTISNIKQLLNHEDRDICYLKIDIEYSEWGSLSEALSKGELRHVRQLGIEVHLRKILRGHYSHLITYYSQVLRQLEKAGFRKWKQHGNVECAFVSKVTGLMRYTCYELYYVNINYRIKK